MPAPTPISNDDYDNDDDAAPTLRDPTTVTINIEDVPTRKQAPSQRRRYRSIAPALRPTRRLRFAANVAVVVGATSLFSTFGCSSEDETSSPLAAASAPPPSARNGKAAAPSASPDAGSSASPSANADPAEEPPAAQPPPAEPTSDPCANSTPVHSFTDATNAWRYSLDSAPPPGFTYRGIAFRLPLPGTADADRDLYFLENAQTGDYLVTQRSDEAADLGYAFVATLGRGWSKPHAGSVALVRFVQGIPRLRHRAELESGVIPDGWELEPPRGYVCPS